MNYTFNGTGLYWINKDVQFDIFPLWITVKLWLQNERIFITNWGSRNYDRNHKLGQLFQIVAWYVWGATCKMMLYFIHRIMKQKVLNPSSLKFKNHSSFSYKIPFVFQAIYHLSFQKRISLALPYSEKTYW